MLPFLYLFAVSDTVLLHIWFTLRRGRHNSADQIFCALYRPVPADLDVRHNLSSQVLSKISGLTNCAALLSPRGPSLALRAIYLVPHAALIEPYV